MSHKDRPAALVVCSFLGWPITGGVAAAIRQLIYYLNAIGFAIYCTAFKVNNDDQNKFREFDVNVIYPDPPEIYRNSPQDISWLQTHELYFPDIRKIERVKMVFGFSMVTSYQAFAIRDKTFPDASFYLINPYKLDTPSSILGYSESQREIWKRSTLQSSKDAKAVFSIGSEIFKHFDSYYQCFNDVVDHRSLQLTPADDLFRIKRPSTAPESGNFSILMFVDENDIKELSRKSVVAKAMNHVADMFHKMSQEPPKWIIVSIPKGRENDIKCSLNPHPHLKITYKSFSSSEVVTLLQQSHLVLIPPSSINSINLSLSTIATGTPLLVPQFSPSHKAIKEYIDDLYLNDITVDMEGDHTKLRRKLSSVMNKYQTYYKRADIMRWQLKEKSEEIWSTTKSEMGEIALEHENLASSSHVKNWKGTTARKITQVSISIGLAVLKIVYFLITTILAAVRYLFLSPINNQYIQRQSASKNSRSDQKANETSCSLSDTADENCLPSEIENHDQRRECLMVVSLRVKDGAPENDKPISVIESDLFRNASTQTNAQDYMASLTTHHPGLYAEAIEEGSLNFVIRCGSSDAADALWNAYSSGRLDRMADKTFLSIPILDDIGARMLSLETFIDYQEYLQCKQDIEGKEAVTKIPNMTSLRKERKTLDGKMKQIITEVNAKEQFNMQKKIDKDSLHSTFVKESEAFDRSRTFDEWVSLNVRSRYFSKMKQLEASQKLGAQRDELKRELELVREKMDAQRQKLNDQFEEIKKEISVFQERSVARAEMISTKFRELTTELSLLEESDDVARRVITDQIGELKKELTSLDDGYKDEMGRLGELQSKLNEDLSVITDRIDRTAEIDELIFGFDRINQGIFPKNTVRRLSRRGNGPGEVWHPQGLTINQNRQVLVSDRGDNTQPGSVKTVTADTAQIISTITFHGLPNIFKPTDVKMSKNNLYYIADDGNKCILVCDAKSRLKQIIDIGEVDAPQICLGPDNTVFVADYNGCVIKYSKAGEMISSKELRKPFITMNSKYQLIVSVDYEFCIYVLDSNLNTLHTFGHGHLVDPRGVSVDAIGENIYVADENKVKIFSAQGEYLTDVTVDGRPEFIAVFADSGIVYTHGSDVTVCVIYT